jgi:predicted RNase H-like HicB family nuclease
MTNISSANGNGEIKKMNKYAIAIFYNDEDEGYIAVVPELPGCSAFGETEETALREVKVAIALWLETAQKEGREIPQPQGKELLSTLYETAVSTTRPQKA